MSKAVKLEEPIVIKPKKIKIDDSFCFRGNNFTVKEMHRALKAYHTKKKSHTDWLYNDDIAIFVDANVLLNIYFSPVPLRAHLARFLQDNKNR